MIIEITGTTGGLSPYDVFLCNTGGTFCFFVSGNTNIPPSVTIDTNNYFPGEDTLLLRLIDTNGCVFDEIQYCYSCNCWELYLGGCDRGATGATFNYTDCDGVSQILTLECSGSEYQVSVCSLYEPELVSGSGGVLISELICVSGNCTYPTERVFLSTCDIITNFAGNELVYGYFPSTNTHAILNGFLTGPIIYGGGDIAHTANKMWISKAATSAITEYDIVLSPFSGVYNRDIIIPDCIIGAGLTAIDDTTLITTTGTTSNSNPQTIVEIDISGLLPVITIKFNLLTNRKISGDIIYTTTDKIIVTTNDILTSDTYITQYDYSTGILEVDILLSPTINAPFGLFTDSGKIHITDQSGDIYQIDESTPYNITFIQNAGINFGGASQLPECETTQFT